MNPGLMRALEELLRRVLRSTEHGIDPSAMLAGTQDRVLAQRWRRDLLLVALLSGAVALFLLGCFLA